LFNMHIGEEREREPSDYSTIDLVSVSRCLLFIGHRVEVTRWLSNAGKAIRGVTIGLKYIDNYWNPYLPVPIET
jgi:hypothetical protein